MLEASLFFLYYALLLIFGITTSFAFSNVQLNKKNCLVIFFLFAICGCIQIGCYILLEINTIWKIYPLIAHIPIILTLYFYYHKSLTCSFISTVTAYLCCHPSRWVIIFVDTITNNNILAQIIGNLFLVLFLLLILTVVAKPIAKIYSLDDNTIYIFGIIPISYYLFDYSTAIYADSTFYTNILAIEFLPVFLCSTYLLFCVVYFKEHEEKRRIEDNEKFVRFTIEQQQKEMELLKKNEKEIRILRHDLRFLLDSISYSIENDNKEHAQALINKYLSRIQSTIVKKYCSNETINYIIASFEERCVKQNIAFQATIEVDDKLPDETMLFILLSNALENALHAQKHLSSNQRVIKIILKTTDHKLLILVKNSFNHKVIFVDGVPTSNEKNHGYGVQSIMYITKKLGGNYHFMVEGNTFILRIII